MKRLFKLLILLGSLAVLGVIYVIVVMVTAEKRPDIPTNDTTTDQIETNYTAAQIDINTMYALKYNSGNEVYSFSLSTDETHWLWTDNPALPLDNNYFAVMASSLQNVTTELKLKVSSSELGTYGLNSPWLEITVSDNTYSTQTFSFGTLNSFTGQYYFMSSSDVNTVYLVDADIPKNFTHTPLEMIKDDVIPTIAENSISSIHITSPTEDIMYRCHTDEGLDAWYVSNNSGEENALSDELASKLGTMFSDMKLENPVGFSQEDRKSFGLSEPTTITVSYTDTKTVTNSQTGVSTDVTIDADFELLLGYADGNGGVYVGLPDSVLVYVVDCSVLSQMCSMVTKSN
ncbi:MAG: DUF4340 domain-containing protein [Eubacteriales bacterium]|nr:DUF4340 domain-containing protein [Eubacteriales bacterium]